MSKSQVENSDHSEKKSDEGMPSYFSGRDDYKNIVNISSITWHDVFDTITDFVSIHDNEMKLIKVNKSLSVFLDEKPDALVGKYCYEVIHKRKSSWPSCPHIIAMRNNAVVTKEVDDPNIGMPLLITCSPFFSVEKDFIGSVHVAREISQQKYREQKQADLILQLKRTLAKVKHLSGLLSICSNCKKIRRENGDWCQIESYITKHSEALFSHGICPDCCELLYGSEYSRGIKENNRKK